MSGITFIKIPVEILRLNISDKAKMLMGLICGFNAKKGLMMSNEDIGAVLGCSGDYVTKLLAELKEFVEVKNPQSRYRKIFYFVETDGVNDAGTPSTCPATPSTYPATPSVCPATPSKSTDIIEKNKIETKRNAAASPLPAGGQSKPPLEKDTAKIKQEFAELLQKLGKGEYQPLTDNQLQQKKQNQINGLRGNNRKLPTEPILR